MKKKPASSPASSPINVPPAFDVSNQAPTQTAISAQPIEEPSEPVNDGAEE